MNITRQQLIILAGLLLAGYAVACTFGYLVGHATPPPAPVALPTSTRRPTPMTGPERTIELVEWTWYESGTGNYIYVDGLVKNVSDKTVKMVELHIELRDEGEKLLATDSGLVDISTLEPGQESTFKLMTPSIPGTEIITIKNISWYE